MGVGWSIEGPRRTSRVSGKRGAAFLIAALAVFAHFGMEATAAAAVPPCSAQSVPLYSPSFPPTLAWKTPEEPKLDSNIPSTNWPASDPSIQVQFQPAQPGGRLASAFSYVWPNQLQDYSGPRVEFSQDDGPATLTWSWDESTTYGGPPTCRRTISQVISPVRGTIPKLKVGIHRTILGQSFVVFSWNRLCPDYDQSAASPITLTVRVDGVARSMRKSDQCNTDFFHGRGKGRGFRLSATDVRVYLSISTHTPGNYPIRYRYKFGHKVRATGHLLAQVRRA